MRSSPFATPWGCHTSRPSGSTRYRTTEMSSTLACIQTSLPSAGPSWTWSTSSSGRQSLWSMMTALVRQQTFPSDSSSPHFVSFQLPALNMPSSYQYICSWTIFILHIYIFFQKEYFFSVLWTAIYKHYQWVMSYILYFINYCLILFINTIPITHCILRREKTFSHIWHMIHALHVETNTSTYRNTAIYTWQQKEQDLLPFVFE